jgi:hypothetical protein
MPRLAEPEMLEQFEKLREETKEAIEDELTRAKEARKKANEQEKAKEERARTELKDAGTPIDKLEKDDQKRNKEAADRIKRTREELIKGRSRLAEDLRHNSFEKVLMPGTEGGRAALVGRELYASDVKFLEHIEGEVGNPFATPYDPYTANPWCWASGGGWWNSADITIYSTFWFYFYPWANQYFSITPHVNFHGFYILRADDAWWNSKYAKVECDVRVRAYQYNWKPEAVFGVINHGDDNIDYSTRFDDERHFYYSFLGGAGDLAWIRVMVRIYAYARGDGSYAEINFSDGVANYLQTPHVHVY